jgi:hypothetical protein
MVKTLNEGMMDEFGKVIQKLTPEEKARQVKALNEGLKNNLSASAPKQMGFDIKSEDPKVYEKEKEINDRIEKLMEEFDKYQSSESHNQIVVLENNRIKLLDDGFYGYVELNNFDLQILTQVGKINYDLVYLMNMLAPMVRDTLDISITTAYRKAYFDEKYPDDSAKSEEMQIDPTSDTEFKDLDLKEEFSKDRKEGTPVRFTQYPAVDECMELYAMSRNQILFLKYYANLLLMKMGLKKDVITQKYMSVCDDVFDKHLNTRRHITLKTINKETEFSKQLIYSAIEGNEDRHNSNLVSTTILDNCVSNISSKNLINKENCDVIIKRISRKLIKLITKGVDHVNDFSKPSQLESDLLKCIFFIAKFVHDHVVNMSDKDMGLYNSSEINPNREGNMNLLLSLISWCAKTSNYPATKEYKDMMNKKKKQHKKNYPGAELKTDFLQNRFGYAFMSSYLVDILGIVIFGDGYSRAQFMCEEVMTKISNMSDEEVDRYVYGFFVFFAVFNEFYDIVNGYKDLIEEKMKETNTDFVYNERFGEIINTFFISNWLLTKLSSNGNKNEVKEEVKKKTVKKKKDSKEKVE